MNPWTLYWKHSLNPLDHQESSPTNFNKMYMPTNFYLGAWQLWKIFNWTDFLTMCITIIILTTEYFFFNLEGTKKIKICICFCLKHTIRWSVEVFGAQVLCIRVKKLALGWKTGGNGMKRRSGSKKNNAHFLTAKEEFTYF